MNDIAAPILMVFIAGRLGVRVEELELRKEATSEEVLLEVV